MGNFYGTVIFATFGICIGLFAYIIRPAIIEKTVMDMRKYELYLKPLNSTQIANCLMDNRCIDV